jgi:DNA-binding transcriptional MerR regulator
MIRIGQMATLTGVSAATLRLYERNRLLTSVERSASGQRLYPAEAQARVRLVRAGLSLGFSLAELRRILAIRDSGGAPCELVQQLAQEHLNRLDQTIRDLSHARIRLRRAVASWKQPQVGGGKTQSPGRLLLLERYLKQNPQSANILSPNFPSPIRNAR